MNKQYRYSNYINNKIISESDWLLQASNSKGQIYDNLRGKFIEPHPDSSLIEDVFNLEWLGQPLSVALALEESRGLLAIELGPGTEVNMTHAMCLNPEVKVIFEGE